MNWQLIQIGVKSGVRFVFSPINILTSFVGILIYIIPLIEIYLLVTINFFYAILCLVFYVLLLSVSKELMRVGNNPYVFGFVFENPGGSEIFHGPMITNRGNILAAPLWDAAKKGDNSEIERLLKAGVNINAKDNSLTALHYAAFFGHAKTCGLLLENGADVNATDQMGFTPLIWSAKNGNAEICKLLIDKGANVNARNYQDGTALFYAKEKGNAEIINILKQAGAK